MNLSQFKNSLSAVGPPEGVSQLLLALWHDARGEWEKAHDIAQDTYNADGAWLHAYLHRKEGDLGNAGYWYRRAGRPMPSYSLEEEWEAMANTFLPARQA
jgi:hypothetical protein